MSVYDVETQVQLSRSTLSRLERNAHDLKISALARACWAYSYPLSQLLAEIEATADLPAVGDGVADQGPGVAVPDDRGMPSASTKPAAQIYRYAHRLYSCRTKDGVVELQASDATRIDSMLEAAAVCMGLPPDQGRSHYERWVEDEQPPACDCPPCLAVRQALRVEQQRLAVGGYRDAEGFWVLPAAEERSTGEDSSVNTESPAS
ncbi:transcriptional regulator [Streptomyces sp. SID8381]|nr:transcriptional regulator [Streptomyces sp. SID8381]